MPTLTIIALVLFVQGTLSSPSIEAKSIVRVLTQDCPSIKIVTLQNLAEKVVDLYDQASQIWNVALEELPEDCMIWDEIFDLKPSLAESAKRLSDEVGELFDIEQIDSNCMVSIAFFTNIARLSGKENYIMTRISMEHCPWLKKDISLLLQLQSIMRYTSLEDGYGLKLLNENLMLQLEEFARFGYRFALRGKRTAYLVLLKSLFGSKQTIATQSIKHNVIDEDDKRKILACLREGEDLITVKEVSYVKRTSDFFPVLYWMSIYYKMTTQSRTRLFEFSAEKFTKHFGNFYRLSPIFKLLSPKNPRQRMEIVVLFNALSTFGRYLGIREDYLSLRNHIVSLLSSNHDGFS